MFKLPTPYQTGYTVSETNSSFLQTGADTAEPLTRTSIENSWKSIDCTWICDKEQLILIEEYYNQFCEDPQPFTIDLVQSGDLKTYNAVFMPQTKTIQNVRSLSYAFTATLLVEPDVYDRDEIEITIDLDYEYKGKTRLVFKELCILVNIKIPLIDYFEFPPPIEADDWNDITDYIAGDVVKHDGLYFTCTEPSGPSSTHGPQEPTLTPIDYIPDAAVGNEWSSINFSTSADWVSGVYGETRFVIIAKNGTVTYSQDYLANAWFTTTLSRTDIEWKSVAFGAGTFVALATTGETSISTDCGRTWTNGGTLPISAGWNQVIYSDGHFIAGTDNSCYFSIDGGTSWTISGGVISNHGFKQAVVCPTTLDGGLTYIDRIYCFRGPGATTNYIRYSDDHGRTFQPGTNLAVAWTATGSWYSGLVTQISGGGYLYRLIAFYSLNTSGADNAVVSARSLNNGLDGIIEWQTSSSLPSTNCADVFCGSVRNNSSMYGNSFVVLYKSSTGAITTRYSSTGATGTTIVSDGPAQASGMCVGMGRYLVFGDNSNVGYITPLGTGTTVPNPYWKLYGS